MSISSFDGLTIGDAVGRGATSTVYRGVRNGRELAIKKLSYPSRETRKAFRRELLILNSVNHRNILQLQGSCESPRLLTLFTELCQGGSVFDILHYSNIELALSQQCTILGNVADAMDYLHGLEPMLIHRDLKSPNILLSRPLRTENDVPRVKICDFGSAQMVKAPKNLSEGNAMTKNVGSPPWTAPEVQSGQYDEKVDVYSFAMIMFELLSYQVPYSDIQDEPIRRLSSQGIRPDLREVDPDAPPSLIELMVSCWANDPTDRPDFKSICRMLLQTSLYRPEEIRRLIESKGQRVSL